MSAALAWFVYATAVGLLLGLAALVAEGSAREVGRPARLLWGVAMMGAVVVPLLSFLRPSEAGGVPVVPAFPVLTLPALEVGAAAEGGWLDPVVALFVAWGGASLVLGMCVLVSALRLRVARREWRTARIDGEPVWVTRDLGPAAFGFRRSSIVLPEWALALDASVQRLLVLHEREHARAGDPRLLLGGILLVVLVPWNVALWWMLSRLRLAVEMDCDARVLARAADPRTYGRVLLEVGRRRGGRGLVVAFAEPRRFLERRIRRITARRAANAGGRAAALAALALAPLALAFGARDPEAARSLIAADAAEVAAAQLAAPDQQEPQLRNAAEVRELLIKNYPPLLKDAGIGGVVHLWLYLDATGRARKVQVQSSSGYEALDQAALRVWPAMVFEPARKDGQPVASWVSVPMVFVPESGAGEIRERAVREVREPPVRPRVERAEVPPPRSLDSRLGGARIPAPPQQVQDTSQLRKAPTFTPFTQEPRLLNQEETQQALQRAYPPLLRDAGIGGKANVWFFIEADGRLGRTLLHQSSGHPALDQAALAVAAQMRFTPAKNRERPVPVWVSIPIAFASK